MYAISGKNVRVQNVTLNASTFTEVVPASKFYSVLIKCRTAVDIYFKRYSTDTDYITIPSGQSMSLAISMDADNPFYLKAASATPVAELIYAE